MFRHHDCGKLVSTYRPKPGVLVMTCEDGHQWTEKGRPEADPIDRAYGLSKAARDFGEISEIGY